MASQLPAHLWWDRYGIRVPVLRDVARKLLAQQAGSGAAERVNSEMGFIKNRRSNRMNDPTFERLEWNNGSTIICVYAASITMRRVLRRYEL